MKKRGNIVLFIIFLLLTLFCMAAIFYFSYQKAESSEQESMSLYDWFLSITGFDFISHNAFRKLAHFSEFAALGFCICACVYFYAYEFHPIISLLVCAIYALSDEIHQIFVPGRACRAFDVFVDSCGGAFGIFIFVLIALLGLKIKEKRRAFI